MTDRYVCLDCRKTVSEVKGRRYRAHSDGNGEPCAQTGEIIPEHLEPAGQDSDPSVPVAGVDFQVCPQCDRKVKLTRLGYFEPHTTTLRGGEKCLTSGVRAKYARKLVDHPLPGDELKTPADAVPEVKDSSPEAMKEASRPIHETNLERQPMAPSLELTSTSTPSSPEDGESTPSGVPGPEGEPASAESSQGPFPLAPVLGDGSILQPFSHLFQPFPVPDRITLAEAMSDRGKEIATRLRETFYAYTNRDHSSNRSAQTTLGPSEIGTPCDRQLAMKLLGIRPVNPQEGWAPFVGTAVHVELAKMFEWANGSGSGRYHTEVPVSFGSALVPHGTLDLYDGVLYMVDDHKLMGRYTLNKLIQEGPSDTYRIQVQSYGLGATLAGFKVKDVAIIGWPRQESSLDKLYVHVEPFDRKIAEEAIKRVERIAASVQEIRRPDGLGDTPSAMSTARTFAPGDDCKWCPFHLKGDKEMKRGCPGK